MYVFPPPPRPHLPGACRDDPHTVEHSTCNTFPHTFLQAWTVCVCVCVGVCGGGGVQVPPVYNESGSTCITLNWLREYPEYHNGGAPVIGARVLMRPATHHDWTAEHVYGYAAPDPAAPKARPARVAVFWDGGRAVIGRWCVL